jgi:probable selenium-dependent hydroxylase accessory protein YqeC
MIEPVALDGVAGAIGLGHRELVSLVGGGGKTTLMFAIGRQLGLRTVLTTTTRMGRDQTGGLPVVTGPTDEELALAVARRGVVLARRAADGHKAIGFDGPTCDRWFDRVPGIDAVVVEADGSRRRPFKAPRELEPVVPSRTTALVATVGAAALGRVIADACHRPLRVAAVAGCSPYQRLTPERLARVLLSGRGSRKDCPDGARFTIVINQVADHHLRFVEDLVGIIGGAAPVVAVAPRAVPDPR